MNPEKKHDEEDTSASVDFLVKEGPSPAVSQPREYLVMFLWPFDVDALQWLAA